MKDFNIKITVRNARLLNAIRERYDSAAALARDAGLTASDVSALVTMRARPFRKDGGLTAAAEGVVSALGIPADELWPDHIARIKAKRAQVELEMDAAQVASIAAADDPEKTAIYRQAITRWSQYLTDRERKAIAAHQSGATIDEVGDLIGGVSRERARQILVKAERKMRTAAQRDGVREWTDIA